MLQKILLPFTFLFFYAGMQGQENAYLKTIDSIKLAYTITTADTTRVNQLNTISLYYAALNDKKNSMSYSQKALAAATKISWGKGVVQSYYVMANLPGADVKALLDKALKESLKGGDKVLIGSVYKNLAKVSNEANEKIQYYKKALSYYKQAGNNSLYANMLSDISYAYELKGMYFEAIDYRMQRIKFSEKHDQSDLIDANRMMGLTYLNKGDKTKALPYYLKSIAIADKHKAADGFMLELNRTIGQIYLDLKDYKKALGYFQAALKYDDPDQLYGRAVVLIDISDVYIKMGNTKQARQYLDNAKSLTDAEPLAKKLYPYSLIANSLYKAGNFKESIKSYETALSIATTLLNEGANLERKEIEIALGLGTSYLALAKQQGNDNQLLLKSISVLENVLLQYKQTNNFKELQQCSRQLAEAYELTGQYQKSVKAYKDYIIYKDSISSIDRENAFVKKEADFEYTQKETLLKNKQKLALVQEETRRNYALAGVGILVLISGGAGYAYVGKRKDNRIIAHEKKRSDDLLLNILPYEIAEELKATGEASAQHYDMVSILFTDFVGFTKMAENFSADELINELNHCFKAFDTIITQYNIEKIKTIGDSYMAVSGLPGNNHNHAENAVNAAIAMRDFIEAYKQECIQQGRPYFEMRTGVNSGKVVAGIVGIKKFAYDVWGDAVNIASRMESSGSKGKVNISESTYNLVKGHYDTEYRGELDAKGKGMIKMYYAELKQSV